MNPIAIGPLELDAKAMQLQLDLAPLAEQVANLLAKFNKETDGHGVDVSLECDWHTVVQLGDMQGHYLLTRVGFRVKPTDLPRNKLYG